MFRTILCLPQAPDLEPLHPSTSTENQGSPKSQLPIASPLSSDIGDRNGTETEVVIERGVGKGGLDGEKSGQVSLVDEDMVDQKLEGDGEETVAYVHFCCERHSELFFLPTEFLELCSDT